MRGKRRKKLKIFWGNITFFIIILKMQCNFDFLYDSGIK